MNRILIRPNDASPIPHLGAALSRFNHVHHAVQSSLAREHDLTGCIDAFPVRNRDALHIWRPQLHTQAHLLPRLSSRNRNAVTHWLQGGRRLTLALQMPTYPCFCTQIRYLPGFLEGFTHHHRTVIREGYITHKT